MHDHCFICVDALVLKRIDSLKETKKMMMDRGWKMERESNATKTIKDRREKK